MFTIDVGWSDLNTTVVPKAAESVVDGAQVGHSVIVTVTIQLVVPSLLENAMSSDRANPAFLFRSHPLDTFLLDSKYLWGAQYHSGRGTVAVPESCHRVVDDTRLANGSVTYWELFVVVVQETVWHINGLVAVVAQQQMVVVGFWFYDVYSA